MSTTTKFALLAALLAGTEVTLEEGLAAETIEGGLQALTDQLTAEKEAHTTTKNALTEKTNQLATQDDELTQLREWKKNQADSLNLPPKDDLAQQRGGKTAEDEKDEARAEEYDRLKTQYPGLMKGL
ncbi:hypothetical protein [Siphonobacter sp. SORGH_AS_0500]|uniref:hypothetical protein n=1 Tax=Siphonobacter sp. SORGH_AS_0500 TaxID=1864824 RepID=UPI00285C8A13|nr:hypothetical protein [Siphonobacter sp. SORGH_AS_0500]MDR6194738.1 hypothetical protein [Siphonobacter sp. SORGH_AS_0500]